MHFSRIWAFHCPVLVVEKKKNAVVPDNEGVCLPVYCDRMRNTRMRDFFSFFVRLVDLSLFRLALS